MTQPAKCEVMTWNIDNNTCTYMYMPLHDCGLVNT